MTDNNNKKWQDYISQYYTCKNCTFRWNPKGNEACKECGWLESISREGEKEDEEEDAYYEQKIISSDNEKPKK